MPGEIANPIDAFLDPDAITVPSLFEARVGRTPAHPFLSWEGRAWTYGEAWDQIRRFSGWLLAGATPGDRVASYLPNRPEAVWTWLGTLVAGCTYVPLNRAHRGRLLSDMLARSRARTLVTDREGAAVLDGLVPDGVRTVVVEDEWGQIDAAAPAVGPAPAPADLAGLLYTSGTTGRSKAVQLSHEQVCRGAGWVAWSLELTEEDVLHGWLPLFHVAGQVDSVLPLILAGGSVALYPTFSRSRFWDQVAESGATIFIGFANVVEILWGLPESEQDARTTLRAGIMGRIPVALHRPFEERYGVRLCDVYGMTEIEPMALPAPGDLYPVGSCGRSRPDLEVTVIDGELACRPRRANLITAGYEGDEEATAAAHRDGWFLTGDLGQIDAEGYVYFRDRRRHAIRRRGENISSWELEELIAEHPAVAECAAVGVPSPLGEDDVKVVVASPGLALDPAELHAWCDGRMAAFMVPRYIEVVETLPRADTGKVLKEELRSVGDGVWDAEAA